MCKVDEFVNKEGQCEKLCKKDYQSVTVGGVKYCVKQCSEGYEPMGDSCVALDKAFEPKKCVRAYYSTCHLSLARPSPAPVTSPPAVCDLARWRAAEPARARPHMAAATCTPLLLFTHFPNPLLSHGTERAGATRLPAACSTSCSS